MVELLLGGQAFKDFAVPAQWRRSMISINFQPFNKSMTEVIEYMEKLEVLETTNKQPGTKKMTRIRQKIRLESLKMRLRSFPRNILSPKAER